MEVKPKVFGEHIQSIPNQKLILDHLSHPSKKLMSSKLHNKDYHLGQNNHNVHIRSRIEIHMYIVNLKTLYTTCMYHVCVKKKN